MNKSVPLHAGAGTWITALSVSPQKEDHDTLRKILRNSGCADTPGSHWALKSSKDVDEAMVILRNTRIPVVLCERDLPRGTWKDMVDALASLPDPPFLVVTCRQADDRLWVEALNLGAYDVLQTPFNASEVTRTLDTAWLRWTDRHLLQPLQAAAARSVA